MSHSNNGTGAPTPEIRRAAEMAAVAEGLRAESVLLPRLRLSVASHEFGELELALLPEPMALTLLQNVDGLTDAALELFEMLGTACAAEKHKRACGVEKLKLAGKKKRTRRERKK